mgnify:CR=1 FL=1
MRSRYAFVLAASRWLSANARDTTEAWIAATVLPPLIVETSVEVRDRDGGLLRAETVADGRGRMAVDLAQVDPGYVSALLAYEDKRFYDHIGVDPWALLRAVGQAAWNGQGGSGGSTLTMQVARLLEDSGTGQMDGKIRQIRVALALERRLRQQRVPRPERWRRQLQAPQPFLQPRPERRNRRRQPEPAMRISVSWVAP